VIDPADELLPRSDESSHDGADLEAPLMESSLSFNSGLTKVFKIFV
jgi:hypothetical protein